MKKRIAEIVLPIASVAVFVAVWWLFAKKTNSEIVAPEPALVGKEFISLLKNKTFFSSLGGTMKRVTAAFSLSFACALLFAVLADRFSLLKSAFSPFVVLMRATPTMSVILLCLIWLREAKSPIAVSFLVVFPMLYSAILGVLSGRDRSLDELAEVYGVRKSKVFFLMTFPSVFDSLFSQLVSTFSFCIKLTIAGESLAATKLSLGKDMHDASVNFETAKLLAFTLCAVAAAFLAEILLKLLYKSIKGVIYGSCSKRINKEIRG